MTALQWAAGLLTLLAMQTPAARTPVGPPASQGPSSSGVNLFSKEQDIEIGRESAKEADQKLNLVREPAIQRYVQNLGSRLQRAESPRETAYRFQIVNSRQLHTVAFPGGWVYLYRGLLEKARNESELAGIIAHEIAHVRYRHATAQLSRQLLVQAPIHIASGLLSSGDLYDQLSRLGVSFGTGATYLRYSREQELEAASSAVRTLRSAGLDPSGILTMLDQVSEVASHAKSDTEREATPRDTREPREDALLQTYLFSHPLTDGIRAGIAAEIAALKAPVAAAQTRGGVTFRAFRAGLTRLAYPADEQPQVTESAVPQTNYAHPQSYYRLDYPSDWEITPSSVNGVIIAPRNSVQPARIGDIITRGTMIDIFDVSERPMSLEQATDRLIIYLRQRNQSLRVIPGTQTPMMINNEPGLRTVLVGQASSGTGREVVWVVSRMYYSTLFYMVCVAPEEEFPEMQRTFEGMIASVEMR